jgi:ABC-type nitrate/sulfonate/bicarbonate transport system ATPase subunit
MFSLGVQQKKKMIEFLGAVLSNKHLILVTHDEMEAAALSETTLVIAKGIIHSRPAIKTHA